MLMVLSRIASQHGVRPEPPGSANRQRAEQMYTTLRDIPPGVTVREVDPAPGPHVCLTVIRHLEDGLTRVRLPDDTVSTVPSYLAVVYVDVTHADVA